MRVNNNIVFRDVGGIYFLVDIKEPDYGKNVPLIKINEAGKYIWEQFSASPNIEEIVAKLQNMYGKDYSVSVIRTYVTNFLNYLYDKKYILS